MRASQDAVDLIKKWEGLQLKPYTCPGGVNTIGYGHVLQDGELYESITEETANALLDEDIQDAEDIIDENVGVVLNQEHFDALVAFVFNIGEAAFRTSTLLKKLNSGDFIGASKEFSRWVYVTQGGNKVKMRGLIRRRKDEEELFLSLPWR